MLRLFSSFVLLILALDGFSFEKGQNVQFEVLAVDDDNKPVVAVAVSPDDSSSVEFMGLGENEEIAQKKLALFMSQFSSEQSPDPRCCPRYYYTGRGTRLILGLRAKVAPFVDSFVDGVEQENGSSSRLVDLALADLVGGRIGVQFGDYVEVGADAGTSLFTTKLGAYANVHPFSYGAPNFYISGKYHKTLYFGVVTAVTTDSYEGTLGYRFDWDRRTWYGFVEAGVAVNSKDTKVSGGGSSEFSKGWVHPVVAVGFGIQIFNNY